MIYPDDCIQSIVSDGWWLETDNPVVCRGALVNAFVPHVDQQPYTFQPLGRSVATEHTKAEVEVKPLNVNQPLKQTSLPVAAMPLNHGEVWSAHRAKKRPCLVFGTQCSMVEKELMRGKPNHSTATTYLVAPFYGADSNGKRAGYSDAFIERVRHCEYPQFHWDKLPLPGAEESIMRLDHLQPIGAHYNARKLTKYKLSDDAMDLLDDLLRWLLWGGVPENSILHYYREMIEASFVG